MLVTTQVSQAKIWQSKQIQYHVNLNVAQKYSTFENAVPSLTTSEVCKICCVSSGAASQ
jgi:hypothetical protein